jgi:hypothetical protein
MPFDVSGLDLRGQRLANLDFRLTSESATRRRLGWKEMNQSERLPGSDWMLRVSSLEGDGFKQIEDLWPDLPRVICSFIRDVLGLTGSPTISREQFAAENDLSIQCVTWIDQSLMDLMRYPSNPPIPWDLVEAPGFLAAETD